jgi:hypothetical protein
MIDKSIFARGECCTSCLLRRWLILIKTGQYIFIGLYSSRSQRWSFLSLIVVEFLRTFSHTLHAASRWHMMQLVIVVKWSWSNRPSLRIERILSDRSTVLVAWSIWLVSQRTTWANSRWSSKSYVVFRFLKLLLFLRWKSLECASWGSTSPWNFWMRN